MSNESNTGKTPVMAYLLWFFLGGFGAHRFYMGKTGSGIGMAALTVASAVLSAVGIGLLGFVALFVWWVVDAFLIKSWFKGEQQDASAGDQNDQYQPPMSEAA